jgi:hypothetical protein
MRYKEFRLSLSEQTAPGTVSIMVYFEDDTTQVIDDIPLSVFNSPNFMSQLRDRLSRRYNKIVVRYARVGDTNTQGNPDGNTPDTKMPTTLTTKQDSDDEIQQRPDEVQAPIEPVDDSNSVSWDGVTLVSASELAAQHNAWADRVDANRDNKNDETGETVLRRDNNGNSVDAQGNPVGPQITLPRLGGGSAGEEGEGGEEGQEGGPGSIIGDLYDAITGPGTNETKLIDALKRIKSPAQLNQVVRSYKEAHNSSLPDDIINEFFYDLGNNTPSVIEEVNNVMVPLGWRIVGNRYSTLRWEKVTGNS